MDIITILTDFATEILAAQNAFYERPEQMSMFEHFVVDAGNRAAARVIGQSLTGLDDLIRQSNAREERFIIQRRIERTLITTAGDVTFEQTVFREKEKGDTVAFWKHSRRCRPMSDSAR